MSNDLPEMLKRDKARWRERQRRRKQNEPDINSDALAACIAECAEELRG